MNLPSIAPGGRVKMDWQLQPTADHCLAAMPSRTYPILPSNAVLEYLGEGAANIIYRVSVPASASGTGAGHLTPTASSGDDPTFWRGKLLRLRKDLHHTISCEDTYEATRDIIHCHFARGDVIQQSLVSIKQSRVIERLNRELRTMEPPFNNIHHKIKRLTKRLGVYLADDDHGIVVEDMTAAPGFSMVEFKPKWLVQSPTAPLLSKRCRTCAKRAYENAELGQEFRRCLPHFCPLDLVSRDEAAILRAAKSVLKQSPGCFQHPASNDNNVTTDENTKLDRVVEWAKNSKLLRLLKDIQVLLDPKGVFLGDPQDKSFRAAMSLRDCSLYLTIPDDIHEPITAKLGDLDLKHASKVHYWRALERQLIDEGWYLGTETVDVSQGIHPPDRDCYLSPRRRMTG